MFYGLCRLSKKKRGKMWPCVKLSQIIEHLSIVNDTDWKKNLSIRTHRFAREFEIYTEMFPVQNR